MTQVSHETSKSKLSKRKLLLDVVLVTSGCVFFIAMGGRRSPGWILMSLVICIGWFLTCKVFQRQGSKSVDEDKETSRSSPDLTTLNWPMVLSPKLLVICVLMLVLGSLLNAMGRANASTWDGVLMTLCFVFGIIMGEKLHRDIPWPRPGKLHRKLEHEEEPAGWEAASETKHDMWPDLDELKDALSSNDKTTRLWAVEELKRIPSKECLSILETVIDDKDGDISALAQEAVKETRQRLSE